MILVLVHFGYVIEHTSCTGVPCEMSGGVFPIDLSIAACSSLTCGSWSSFGPLVPSGTCDTFWSLLENRVCVDMIFDREIDILGRNATSLMGRTMHLAELMVLYLMLMMSLIDHSHHAVFEMFRSCSNSESR